MASKPHARPAAIEKTPTGIVGLDEITLGGLPRGRPTLICGSAGCGKSLMGLEFLIYGVTRFHEPGVLMTFEESPEDIAKNVASLGVDVRHLVAQRKLVVDYVHVDRNEIEENGEYDLEGIFIRLQHAIDTIGAKRVMLDTIETLFSGLNNQGILRAEIRRLFYWLKERGMTTVITGERGEGQLTRQGLEEYVSDCVILLDHRVQSQISTRRLRVVKYRGTTHGTNEYPFLIDEEGISVLPITSLGLNHGVSTERITSGIDRLDDMLGGGFYRGSSILLTGTAGTGKSSVAAYFANACCRRQERVIYFAFEESRDQILRNMRSISLDLLPHVRSGKLQFFNSRPTLYGLEAHLTAMHKQIHELKPAVVVVDPISNLIAAGTMEDARAMLVRLIDYLKGNQITAFFTGLTTGGSALEATDLGISSIMDTWLLLRDIELNGERNRGLHILKSRGMNHSNQIREFIITPQGIRLVDAYTGSVGVLTGSARLAQEARDEAQRQERLQEMASKKLKIDRKRKALEAQIESLRAEFLAEEQELLRDIDMDVAREATLTRDRAAMARSRKADLMAETTRVNGQSRRAHA